MLFNMFPRNSLQGEKLYNFSKLLKKNRTKKLFGKHKQLLSYTYKYAFQPFTPIIIGGANGEQVNR